MLARRYMFDGQRAVASPTKSAFTLTGSTTIRAGITKITVGSSASPADNAIEWLCQRFTAAGTSTAVTPTALDPADPASTSTAGVNCTVEPTYTAGAILWHLALNQRGTYTAQFDDPLKIPATANNGIGGQPINSTFTGTVDFGVYFAE